MRTKFSICSYISQRVILSVEIFVYTIVDVDTVCLFKARLDKFVVVVVV